MTVIMIIMALTIAFLIYAGQVYTAELEDRITDLENDLKDHKTEIISLEGKTDRLIRRIKKMKDEQGVKK